jgi:hypothetical protein
MKDIVPTGNVSVTDAPIELITHEKAIVTMDAGCIWTKLENNGKVVGFAYTGPSNFVVDAISETREGAWGESVSGDLSGVQVVLCDPRVVAASHDASIDDYRRLEYPDSNTFIDDVKNRLDGFTTKSKQVKVTNDPGDVVLLGLTSDEKDVVIVASEKGGLVFTHEEQVFVDEKGNTVSVSGGSVGIHNRDGESLVIDKHGIRGLEGLDELRHIGPTIGKAVRKSMKGLKHTKKHMKSGIKRAHRYDAYHFDGHDDVDDLDWDDDE